MPSLLSWLNGGGGGLLFDQTGGGRAAVRSGLDSRRCFGGREGEFVESVGSPGNLESPESPECTGWVGGRAGRVASRTGGAMTALVWCCCNGAHLWQDEQAVALGVTRNSSGDAATSLRPRSCIAVLVRSPSDALAKAAQPQETRSSACRI
ncbi:hypothetical protein BDV95DRAFT_670987 [Massariosphaeria phaeospora]|uniref:Uncharacterized protein n=1 Tax=Massariosphaeria phaeospora TaxID=100035 RepID=A0A7C8M736_9PLEO|nr:hypothetical protein BDV95DRAFT_670987 [Massariosphaeria phaeospora]